MSPSISTISTSVPSTVVNVSHEAKTNESRAVVTPGGSEPSPATDPQVSKSKLPQKIDSGVFLHPDGSRLLYRPDENFEARMCCGQVTSCDKGLMEFLAKTLVSLSVLSFCFIQLSQGQQSEFASSTISLILGTYLGGKIMTGAEKTPVKK